MAKKSFAHLHVHTEYSMLDGAAKIQQLVQAVSDQGMPAIAITDHGNMFGAFEFWKTAKATGVKPIIGIEAYLTPGTDRRDRSRVRWGKGGEDDVSGGGAYTHMTMLAENTAGMHNLFRLASYASIEGQYFKPRMDRELLQTYAAGVIATTGCPSGEIQTRLRLGQYKEALEAAAEFRDIFGANNFYCEIMDHGLDIERRITNDLLKLAKELSLPVIASNDLHYTFAGDARAHEALLCVQSGKQLQDEDRFKFDSDQFYLKSPAEMRELFRDLPEACDNTLAIAERCEAEFATEANYMPRFPVPEGESEESWFIKEVEKGLHDRYRQGIPDRVRKQAEYETGIITQMGFAGYFLVVADFINWAKNNGIRVGPGRGSGAGSMAAYAMRITDLDPLEHGLIFERFLNPDRVSMPDFDVDFDDRRRGEVIKYVTDKYGDERVAQIVTYGTIKSKQALKDAARVLGFPYSAGETLTKAMPPAIMAKDIPLSGIVDQNHSRYKEAAEFRTVLQENPEYESIFDTALGLEGLKRQWGVHAAGVIMSSEPLIDIIPIMKREQDGQIVTQFDYPACESLGLIKMDFLGLRNLTIISDALENIRLNKGDDLVLEDLPLTDVASYELLARGDTLGVFQLDGGPMRALLRLMRPDNFEDISAVLALYRPGPMGADSHTNYALRKNGLQEITPIHPELAEPLADILDTTYGLIIYQEQVMAIAQRVAGYSLGQADILRRAMGKKKKEELDKQFESFSAGMKERGFSDGAVKTLWDILVPFSDYAFNKAHSAAYGLVSYWTAYLKAHYPSEYMAALLTSVHGSRDKLAVYLNECRRMGIKVLPPDVNESVEVFSAVGRDIRFGLGAIRNVGHNVVQEICRLRDETPFESFEEFINRLPALALNKRTIESLIKAGALDQFGKTRRALVDAHERLVEQAQKDRRNEEKGNVGFDFDALFAEDEQEENPFSQSVPDMPEFRKKDKLAFEREMLGLYVSDHPLAGLESTLARKADLSIEKVTDPETRTDGQTVTIAGLVTKAEHRVAKSGNPYATAVIEDFSGEIEAIFFGRTYEDYRDVISADQIVSVRGKVNVREDRTSLQAYTIDVIETKSADSDEPIELRISSRQATRENIRELDTILARYPGKREVHLAIASVGGIRVFGIRRSIGISPDFYGEVKALFGVNCIR